jgi:hypothetical protein
MRNQFAIPALSFRFLTKYCKAFLSKYNGQYRVIDATNFQQIIKQMLIYEYTPGVAAGSCLAALPTMRHKT